MNKALKEDLQNLDIILDKIRDQGSKYLNTIDNRPTSVKSVRSESAEISVPGLGTLETLRKFNERFEPVIVASSGPRYWGFVTGGATPAAIAGDWLATVYDQNTQSTQGQGDISAMIEFETIQLLLELFNLPSTLLGGFVTGATMSNFTCLAVARQWAGKQRKRDIAKDGLPDKIPVLTATPHSSAIKSLSLLGMGSSNIIKVKTAQGNREAMDMIDLQEQIKHLNNEPFILISSGGTVNTVDYDDFNEIARLKEQHNFWWHIDAAFGAFAACSDEYKHLLNGWEKADSITVDCHKWLNVPYESAVFFVKETHKLLQVETFQNSNAPYLGDPLESFSYLNFLPENSRRLKALPVWFSLMAYGKEGYKDIVESCIALAKEFGHFIENNEHFELLAPVRLNTVCFTLSGIQNQHNVNSFLKKINDTGKVFMTPTIYQGTQGIRAAFVNWRTTSTDINIVIKEIRNLLQQ